MVVSIFLGIFTPNPGEMIQFDLRIFFRWVGSTTNQGCNLLSTLGRKTVIFSSTGRCWRVGCCRFLFEKIPDIENTVVNRWMVFSVVVYLDPFASFDLHVCWKSLENEHFESLKSAN